MHRKPLTLLAAVTATLAGCGNPFEICTTQAVPALSVTVVDSVSGASLAPEALVWAGAAAGQVVRDRVGIFRYLGPPEN